MRRPPLSIAFLLLLALAPALGFAQAQPPADSIPKHETITIDATRPGRTSNH
jgi:hypothetical protein